MSGTRFARSGRCRFFFCLGALVFTIFTLCAIFHSSQQQLDETREQRLRCEQQQEALNERMQNIVEQKFNLEKTHERERNEQMEARRNLEQKLTEANAAHVKDQTDAHTRYEKLQQAHRRLQNDHNELVSELAKVKKEHLTKSNELEKKLQSLRTDLNKEKNMQSGEITVWKDKYNTLVLEKERLEGLLNAADANGPLHSHLIGLERIVSEYQQHCTYKPKEAAEQHNLQLQSPRHQHHSQQQQQQLNKPLSPPDTTSNGNVKQAPHSLDKPRNEKSFREQEMVPKPIKKLSEEPETQLRQQPAPDAAMQPAALLAGDKMVSPLSAPRKSMSTVATKAAQHVLEANAQLKRGAGSVSAATNSTAHSSAFPPLPVPPNNGVQQRKLPANVAPIPANFDELLNNNNNGDNDSHNRQQQQVGAGNSKKSAAPAQSGEAADIDAAVEDMQKNENGDDGANNRYANVINDIEHKAAQKAAAAANEDSGAHEIKDHDFMNDQNFNLPPDEDNNFFDGGVKNAGDVVEKHNNNNDDDNEDDMMMGDGAIGGGGGGDIAVKNHNNLLDTENLNNEVVGDQGKEFDGLRLEDGNEEDEDEDDYSNLAARQQGAQAIRN